MKALFRKYLPKSWLYYYHHLRGWLAALRFGFPASRLTVIAVTGTNGKTSTVSFIGQLLQMLDQPVGWISTATISIRGHERLNATKLTTADPEYLQATLRQMVRAGCRYAIIEASSEGLYQGRLNGIRVMGAVFTNLTPEHIESHGSFEKYAQAKERLFQKVNGRSDTFTVVNLDDPEAARFLAYSVGRIYGCTLSDISSVELRRPLILMRAEDISESTAGIQFRVAGQPLVTLPLRGRFNLMNTLEAIAVTMALGFPVERVLPQLPRLQSAPGRLELLELGTPFQVLVDYAPEPASMAALYSVIPQYHPKRIIHVFGSCGGMRDHARRPILGKFVAERADIAIITNEDPYDEPPEKILDEIMAGVTQAIPKKALVERILDRRRAIERAMELAQPGDLVVITGKASEQWIMSNTGKIPWDDRRVARESAEPYRKQVTEVKS